MNFGLMVQSPEDPCISLNHIRVIQERIRPADQLYRHSIATGFTFDCLLCISRGLGSDAKRGACADENVFALA